MQRQGGFAFPHQSANAGKMVNFRGKRRIWGGLRENGQEVPAQEYKVRRAKYDERKKSPRSIFSNFVLRSSYFAFSVLFVH
jgi:hypothetical protein